MDRSGADHWCESAIHTLAELEGRRLQEVEFLLAKLVLEKYYRDNGEIREDRPERHRFDRGVQVWRFPDVLRITREWTRTCLHCSDNTFPQMLLFIELAHNAAERIQKPIQTTGVGQKAIRPILAPYDVFGSTRYVQFDTPKPVYPTDPKKCHVNYVVADTESWEQKMAQALEEMDEVIRYVKNDHLGFAIPYSIDNEQKHYFPDFILHIDDGQGAENPLNMVIEVTGERRPDKVVKVTVAQTFWIPAANNHGGFGRWAFLEIVDPWNAKSVIRNALNEQTLLTAERA